MSMIEKQKKKLVVIGGGTGSFTLLQGLKDGPYEITSLVNMVDDGGSSGVLRDELGVLPPGDIRQCLVALSEAPKELRDLFNFRFPKSTFEGHSFGNLFLSAVEKMTDNFDEAIRLAGDVLRIKGRVVPITLDDCQLVMEQQGKTVVGENLISQQEISREATFSVSPAATAHHSALDAICHADIILIAPGSLFRSIIPNFLVEGVSEALRETPAKVVYIANLVNKPRETQGYNVDDHVRAIERYAGRGAIDYVLYNTDEPTSALLKRYADEGDHPVDIAKSQFDGVQYKPIAGRFLSHEPVRASSNDTLPAPRRTYIRHDVPAVVRELMKL